MLFLSPTRLKSLMSSVTHPGPQLILGMAASGVTKQDQQLVLPSKALSLCSPVPSLAFLPSLLTSHCTLTGWSPKLGPGLQPFSLLQTGVLARPPFCSKSFTLTLVSTLTSSYTSPDPNQANEHCSVRTGLPTPLPSMLGRP